MPTLSYGRGRQRVLDLDPPASQRAPGERSAGHPVAFVLHGGFWRAGYRRDLMAPLCADLRTRGWATANVEYRRVGRRRGGGGGVPQTLEDVAAALDRLADADAFLLDLDRVVTIGHSAGGQLALWAAGERPGARVRPAGAVSQGGVCDLVRAAALRLGDGAAQGFCGGPPEAVPDAYRRASPAARLPLRVPALLVHGDEDDRVPVALSEAYAERARAAGDDVELVVRPGTGHFEHLDPTSGVWADVCGWLGRRF